MLHLGRLERQVLADRQVISVLAAGGQEDLELTSFDEARAAFDAALAAPPVAESASERLLRELGVS